MVPTTTLIDAKRVVRDGASYRVTAHIDQEVLARLVGEMTEQAARQGRVALAEGAIVITAERSGKVSGDELEAMRREMQARLPDLEDGSFLL